MNKTASLGVAGIVALSLLSQANSSVLAAPAPPPANAIHIRGTVQKLAGQLLIVGSVRGPLQVQLAPNAKVLLVVPSDRAHIKDGTFLGITSVPQAGGGQRAVEVHIFPESMRGAGEGSRGWDWPGAGKAGSKMTNGTAALSKMTQSKMANGTVSSKM
ncbi:MAG: hypothetical protein JOZ57_11630, partial [Abitibacteriaceae bacterium]|nr:hypothetical protein [Abditibacteriaceae bacterium]